MSVETLVFRVGFACENCGNEWGDRYGAGTKVTDEFRGSSTVVYAVDTTAPFGSGRERVSCPNCELDEFVTVRDRKPIPREEDESDE